MTANGTESDGGRRRTTKRRPMLRLVISLALIIAVAVGTFWGLDRYKRYRSEQEARAKHERAVQLGLSDEPVTPEDKASYTVDANDKPRSLTIAKAGVDKARIQEVGLLSPASDGSQQMDAPKNIHDVGWYNCQLNPVAAKRCANYSSPAGSNDQVAAVIDGHSCGGDGCVFDKLSSLAKGDIIEVELGSGQMAKYLVDATETVDLDKLDMTKAMAPYQVGYPGLNLITCDGQWTSRDSRGNRTMSKRVVVYSTLQEI